MEKAKFDVTVVLLEGGMSSTAVMPVDIFHSAGALWNDLHDRPAAPPFQVTTATPGGTPVRSPSGLTLTPESSVEAIGKTDIVIVSTSGLDVDVKVIEGSVLLPWLQRQHDRGAYVAGVCMGAAYLAEAGLLDGRTATTHWALCPKFAARYDRVNWRPDLMITEDNRALCSGGVYSAIDISLYLVEKLCGHEVAVETSKALLLPMPRTQQSGYSMLPLSPPHADNQVRDVETYLQQHYFKATTIEELARRVGMGARTFVRRFKAATGRMPAAYLQAVRIETAKAMLEREGHPIQTVSSAVGYDDVAFFRSLFKRATGMTPAEYRAHFGPMAVRA